MLADVRIEDGVIAEVGSGLARGAGADVDADAGIEVIDASGLLVMPGGVDAHTHMDLQAGDFRASDSFLTGTRAAACGGTTAIIDHLAFGPAGCNLMHQVDAYHKLARGAVIDYGFHGVVQRVDDDILAELPRLVDEGVTSLKFYMTYDYRLKDADIIRLLERTRELGILACVHCENHAMLTHLRARFLAEGKTAPSYHAASRPPTCEAEAVFRVLSLAHVAGDAPLYLVHNTSAAALAAASMAGETGDGSLSHQLSFAQLPPNVTLETCPQYLVLDEGRYELPGDEGLKFIMSPPLRTPSDAEALWEALACGFVSTVGTDHCPFYFDPDKLAGKDDFTRCPNGIPGVELRLALLHSEGVVKRGMSLNRMVEVASTAPARCFGIYPQKGTIAVGSDADIVLFDPVRKVKVTHALLHEQVDYTPYEGMELTGYPVMTISRGEVIVREGTFLGAEGRGRFLKRKTRGAS
jgi:dihydropyrimidinase